MAKDRCGPGCEMDSPRRSASSSSPALICRQPAVCSPVFSHQDPRRVAERVHAVAGGNALYVLALGAELARAHADGDGWREVTIPNTLTDAIARQLEHVSAGVETALFAVAALADPTIALLGAAFGEFDVEDLDDAVRAGVIEIAGDHIRFTHPLLASVHYASVPVVEQHELHLRLARVVPNAEERLCTSRLARRGGRGSRERA